MAKLYLLLVGDFLPIISDAKSIKRNPILFSSSQSKLMNFLLSLFRDHKKQILYSTTDEKTYYELKTTMKQFFKRFIIHFAEKKPIYISNS